MSVLTIIIAIVVTVVIFLVGFVMGYAGAKKHFQENIKDLWR